MDSLEVINERVKNLASGLQDHIRDCGEEHKELKANVISLHKRLDKILEAMQNVVVVDQKVNTVSAHVSVIEDKLRDYDSVKKDAGRAHSALTWVNGIIITAVLGAIFSLIFTR